MTTNFVRRRIYTRAAPPDATGAHIDGYKTFRFGMPHAPMPHFPMTEFWRFVVDDLVDAATASTGFWPAWGRGDPAWDETPDDDTTGETALVDPLGIFPGSWSYIEPDVAGAIIMRDGSRWTVAGAQTQYVLVEAPYAGVDEPTEAIREIALYTASEPAPAHTSDPYLPMANVDDLGDLVAIDRIAIVNRSLATSGKVRFLVRVENV